MPHYRNRWPPRPYPVATPFYRLINPSERKMPGELVISFPGNGPSEIPFIREIFGRLTVESEPDTGWLMGRFLVAICLFTTTVQASLAQSDLLLRIRQGGKYGFIDQRGKVVISPKFYWAWAFQERRALVYICGKYGFVDEKGKLAIPARFDAASMFFRNGLAGVQVGKLWGYVDTTGQVVISPRFDRALDFSSNGLAPVEVGGKWGYIDRQGTFAILPTFKSAGLFSDGFAPVQSEPGDKWGFISESGRYMSGARFDAACEFSEGLACIQRGGKWGYINRNGIIAVSPRYRIPPGDFSDGVAVVVVDYKYGFIDKTGKLAISPRFDVAYSFTQGIAVASADGKTGFIDRRGRWISPPHSGGADFLAGGFVAVVDEKDGVTGDEWGYMGPDGKFIWRAPITEAPTHEMWPVVGFDETQRQKEIEKSCQTDQ